MKKPAYLIVNLILIAGLAVFSACSSGGGSSSSPPPSGNTGIVPTPTSAGTPTGTPSSAVIGKNGGIITSVDSRVTLSIPASALTSTMTITIQPITNTAHGGIGPAYELLPNGLTLAKPAALTLTYTDAEIVGTDPEFLIVAFQKADGYWELIPAAQLTTDAATKTITASISHFSGWVIYEALRLRPVKQIVKTGDFARFQVEICHDILGYRELKGWERPILGQACGAPAAANTLSTILSGWSVNDIVNGNSTFGRIDPHVDWGIYAAPAKKPSPDTVTVSVNVNNLKDPLKLFTIKLASQVTIIDDQQYGGSVSYTIAPELEQSAGTYTVHSLATVTWTKFEDTGDVRRYLPEGSMRVDVEMQDCDPVTGVRIPIATSSPTAPADTLTVYTSTNVAFPKTFAFSLRGSGTIQMMCGNPRTPTNFPAQSLTSLMVQPCPSETVYLTFDTEDVLCCSFRCPEYNVRSSVYHFQRP